VNQILIIFGFCVFAYLLCSVPFGEIIGRLKIGKLKSVDLQKVGSGNIGATNAFREAGRLKGSITAILDVGKATLPVFLAKDMLHLDLQGGWQPNVILLAVIISALLGSIFPIWLKFKGGKGMSVLFGSLLVILGWNWLILLICFLYLIVEVAGRMVSLASMILVGFLLPFLGFIWGIPFFYYLWVPASLLIILWAHRENRSRLKKGEEKPYPIPSIFARNKSPGLGT